MITRSQNAMTNQVQLEKIGEGSNSSVSSSKSSTAAKKTRANIMLKENNFGSKEDFRKDKKNVDIVEKDMPMEISDAASVIKTEPFEESNAIRSMELNISLSPSKLLPMSIGDSNSFVSLSDNKEYDYNL